MSNHYQELEEAYEVVKVAILVHSRRTFRIEVLHDMQKTEDVFSVRAYVSTAIKATPVYPDDHLSREIKAWSHLSDFPWVKRDTVDGAMSQAIGFLKDAFKA